MTPEHRLLQRTKPAPCDLRTGADRDARGRNQFVLDFDDRRGHDDRDDQVAPDTEFHEMSARCAAPGFGTRISVIN